MDLDECLDVMKAFPEPLYPSPLVSLVEELANISADGLKRAFHIFQPDERRTCHAGLEIEWMASSSSQWSEYPYPRIAVRAILHPVVPAIHSYGKRIQSVLWEVEISAAWPGMLSEGRLRKVRFNTSSKDAYYHISEMVGYANLLLTDAQAQLPIPFTDEAVLKKLDLLGWPAIIQQTAPLQIFKEAGYQVEWKASRDDKRIGFMLYKDSQAYYLMLHRPT